MNMMHTIGIDEAGRGPLAGPVYVGVVMLPRAHKTLFIKTHAPQKLTDSKKLSPKQREEWFMWMKKNNIVYAYAIATAKQIDKINITRATNRAAQKAYNKIKGKRRENNTKVIADAGIKVQAVYFKSFPKADELIPAVSLASIVAKVMRDRYMCALDKKFPQYGFQTHKGYGTRSHYAALKKYGISPAHRLTFLHTSRTIHARK